MKVDLPRDDWNQVITALAQQHPIIARIAAQLAEQEKANGESDPLPNPINKPAKEKRP